MSTRDDLDDLFPPPPRDIPFDEEVAERRAPLAAPGMSLDELKARRARLAEDLDRRARGAA